MFPINGDKMLQTHHLSIMQLNIPLYLEVRDPDLFWSSSLVRGLYMQKSPIRKYFLIHVEHSWTKFGRNACRFQLLRSGNSQVSNETEMKNRFPYHRNPKAEYWKRRGIKRKPPLKPNRKPGHFKSKNWWKSDKNCETENPIISLFSASDWGSDREAATT